MSIWGFRNLDQISGCFSLMCWFRLFSDLVIPPVALFTRYHEALEASLHLIFCLSPASVFLFKGVDFVLIVGKVVLISARCQWRSSVWDLGFGPATSWSGQWASCLTRKDCSFPWFHPAGCRCWLSQLLNRVGKREQYLPIRRNTFKFPSDKPKADMFLSDSLNRSAVSLGSWTSASWAAFSTSLSIFCWIPAKELGPVVSIIAFIGFTN